MKGSEIIARYQKAKALVESRKGLGEIGNFMRYNGYQMGYDGFNCASFSEDDVDLRWSADNYDRAWEMSDTVHNEKLSKEMGYEFWQHVHISELDPEKDYPIEANLSPMEMLERGKIHPKKFYVRCEGNKTAGEKSYFDTLEDADKCAQAMCAQKIAERLIPENRSISRYYETTVRNDAARAKEHNIFKYYLHYKCDGYRYWIAVGANQW